MNTDAIKCFTIYASTAFNSMYSISCSGISHSEGWLHNQPKDFITFFLIHCCTFPSFPNRIIFRKELPYSYKYIRIYILYTWYLMEDTFTNDFNNG